jgi:outer membrane biosynthesis protein TonB
MFEIFDDNVEKFVADITAAYVGMLENAVPKLTSHVSPQETSLGYSDQEPQMVAPVTNEASIEPVAEPESEPAAEPLADVVDLPIRPSSPEEIPDADTIRREIEELRSAA